MNAPSHLGTHIDTAIFPPAFLASLEGVTLPLGATPHHGSTGHHRSRRVGDSVEFVDIRPYVAGDDVRSVDWNVYRRFRRLSVRRYEAEQSRDILILLDTSRSMGVPEEKFRYAQQIAGAAAVVAGRSADRVTLLTFAEVPGNVTVRGSRGALPRELLAFVSGLVPRGKTALAPVLEQVASRRPRGSALVVISDCLDAAGVEHALSAVLARRLEVLLFHTLAPSDVDALERGLFHLHDAETGEERPVTVDRSVQEQFRHDTRRWRYALRDAVIGAGGHYARCDTTAAVVDTLRRTR